MSRANWTRACQAALILLQTINAGAAAVHLSPAITLMVAAVLAAGQYLVHEAGVQTPPPKES